MAKKLKAKHNRKTIFLFIVGCIALLSIVGAFGDDAEQNAVEPTQSVSQEEEGQDIQEVAQGAESVDNEEIGFESEEDEIEVSGDTEPDLKVTTFDINMVAPYDGAPSIVINDNVPFFTEDDFETTGELYSNLDNLGRCGMCIALVGPETLPTEARGSIGDIKPTGWETVRYAGIDGNYLYNRCHLIGWQLTGENANPKNLITGTRYMNTQGMEPVETAVANYVQNTGNHVLYRSTPIFESDNLLATGVLLEAQSIEDDSIILNVFCYNVQPDIVIDYATGKSEGPDFLGTDTEAEVASGVTRQSKSNNEASSENEATPSEDDAEDNTDENPEVTYVGNGNSHKFHKPSCSSVSDMKEWNKVYFYGDRQEVIDAGYTPCKRCNP